MKYLNRRCNQSSPQCKVIYQIYIKFYQDQIAETCIFTGYPCFCVPPFNSCNMNVLYSYQLILHPRHAILSFDFYVNTSDNLKDYKVSIFATQVSLNVITIAFIRGTPLDKKVSLCDLLQCFGCYAQQTQNVDQKYIMLTQC